MPRLTPLKPKDVIDKLRRLGYEGPFPGGRHSRMVHPDGTSGRYIRTMARSFLSRFTAEGMSALG